jgi:Flp pilus assembly protein TadG
MAANRLINRLQAWFNLWRRDRGANVVITFALLLVPVAGAVGAAIDYSRANSARTAMQNALDSAALTLGKEASGLDPTYIDGKASDYFNAIFTRPEAGSVSVSSEYVPDVSLTLYGSGNVGTSFLRVLGFNQINITASSTVNWGTTKKLEIALVLDNTGSMASSGKIDALTKASQEFIDAMKKASKKTGDVKVAIVPFDTHVNIGTSYKDSAWLDWSLMSGTSGGTTTWNSANNYGDADDDTRSDNDRIDKDSWTGCLIDRAQPYDTDDTTPSGDSATWYPAENCDLATILPLTTDWSTAKSTLGKMKASGKTNLTIGLVWGWHALTPNVPLTEGSAPAKNIDKYILFLTDGLNTQNRFTTKAPDIDARTKLVCDKIKAAGIRIYTIRVMEGNQSLLTSCATSPSMYYNVTAANQISPVFTEIAQSLVQLRLSK